jgi:hypothetical protein
VGKLSEMFIGFGVTGVAQWELAIAWVWEEES